MMQVWCAYNFALQRNVIGKCYQRVWCVNSLETWFEVIHFPSHADTRGAGVLCAV